MKRKFKKLSLNTETLGSLSDSGLRGVAGATAAETDCLCTQTGRCTMCTGICTLCGIGCSAPCG